MGYEANLYVALMSQKHFFFILFGLLDLSFIKI